MKNHSKIILLFSLLALLFTTSCDDDDDTTTLTGDWSVVGQFNGDRRTSAVAFVIDKTVYVGLGYNSNHSEPYYKDFYASNDLASWEEVDTFPGTNRKGATAFSVGGKGYVVGGYNDEDYPWVYYNDMWEFDPATSSWTQLSATLSFPLADAVSFQIGTDAYIAGGHYESDITKKECYKFDTSTKSFVPVAAMNFKKTGAFAFVIDDKAYVGGGYDGAAFREELEMYDPEADTWSLVDPDLYMSESDAEDYGYDSEIDLRRRWSSAFVMDKKAYLVGGFDGTNVLSDCWEFDPSTKLWTELNGFEYNMYPRQKAVSFELNDIGYIMTGQYGTSIFLDDILTIDPDKDEE